MIKLRLMSLSGKFKAVKELDCETWADALAAVKAHAQTGNFTNVKRVDEDDLSYRYTARTPGGRGGRNIAFADLDWNYTDDFEEISREEIAEQGPHADYCECRKCLSKRSASTSVSPSSDTREQGAPTAANGGAPALPLETNARLKSSN